MSEKTRNSSKLKSFFLLWTTDSWGWESLSWVTAVLLLVIAVALLAFHDNRELPQWYLGITLNTILSVVSGLFQWSLMMPVIACIGQLKWLWFIQPKRPLSEFTKFEEASSSPFGAFTMFRTSRITHLVSIGAFITIVAPAVSTFIQQALSYQLRLKPSGDAIIPRCTRFIEVDGLESSLKHTYSINAMKFGIYDGLYNSNIDLSNVTASCATGNCSWPIHSSLAICASIADLTPLVITSCSLSNSSCTYSLPSGGILAGKNEFMSLTLADEDEFASIAFPDSIPILDVFTFLISNKTAAPVLLESSLNLCVQSYNVSVSSGKTNATLLDSWHTLNTTGNFVVEVPGQNTTFEMGDYSFESITNFLRQIFVGTFVIDNGTITYGSDAIEVLADSLFVAPWDEAAMSIFLEGMATSMTNTLRSGDWSEKVSGTSYSPATYVKVQWLWIIPPIVFLILTLIFLLTTMMRSKQEKTKLWKTSGLATLRALSPALRNKLGTLEAATVMEKTAEELFVQLKDEGGGWRLTEYISV